MSEQSSAPAAAKEIRERTAGSLRWIIGPAIAVARHIDNRRWFLASPTSTADRARRRRLLEQFRAIDRAGLSQHGERELLFIADQILRLKVDGPLVECGCYQGGSTAKLSLVARELDRTLYVCDSFQGLPTPSGATDGVFTNRWGRTRVYTEGAYASSREQTLRNIAAHGDASRCVLVEGFFSDTLPSLDIEPAFVFMDVDLVSSARDCLKYLWPRLRPGGLFFSHEASYNEYVAGVTDPAFWLSELHAPPPQLFGAIYGVSYAAGDIGFFRKPAVPVTVDGFTLAADGDRRPANASPR